MGASSRMDGHHCAIFPANGANTPVEIFESDTPLCVVERGLVIDSGGPGQKRGGLGRKEIIRVPDYEYAPMPPVTIAIQAGRYRYPPQGLFGGGMGEKAKFLIDDQPGDPSGLTFCRPGQVVAFYSAGGGGYGDPLKRDPEDVGRDVTHGYVSIERAKTDYEVIVYPVTLEVDYKATEKLRSIRK